MIKWRLEACYEETGPTGGIGRRRKAKGDRNSFATIGIRKLVCLQTDADAGSRPVGKRHEAEGGERSGNLSASLRGGNGFEEL